MSQPKNKKADNEKYFYEHALWSVITIGLLSLFCFAVVIYVIGDDKFKGIMAFAIAIGFAWLEYKMILRLQRPFLRLRSSGFSFSDFSCEIPWDKVAEFRVITQDVYAVTSTIHIIFTLVEGYEPPPFTPDSRVKYKKENRTLHISITNLRPPLTTVLLSHEIDAFRNRGLKANAQSSAF
jgi:hypothetical protein